MDIHIDDTISHILG